MKALGVFFVSAGGVHPRGSDQIADRSVMLDSSNDDSHDHKSQRIAGHHGSTGQACCCEIALFCDDQGDWPRNAREPASLEQRNPSMGKFLNVSRYKSCSGELKIARSQQNDGAVTRGGNGHTAPRNLAILLSGGGSKE